jgi:hypothetical protein
MGTCMSRPSSAHPKQREPHFRNSRDHFERHVRTTRTVSINYVSLPSHVMLYRSDSFRRCPSLSKCASCTTCFVLWLDDCLTRSYLGRSRNPRPPAKSRCRLRAANVEGIRRERHERVRQPLRSAIVVTVLEARRTFHAFSWAHSPARLRLVRAYNSHETPDFCSHFLFFPTSIRVGPF